MLIYGRNSVVDAVKNKLPIKKIYILKGHTLPIKFKQIEFVDKSFLARLTRGNHQGFIAEVAEFEYSQLDSIFKDKPDRVLVLDHIEDPQNFGAIIRLCNAAGVNHILIAKDRQVQVTSAVLKVASGGIANMKIIRVTNLSQTLRKLKQNNWWIYTTALNNGISCNKVKFQKPYVLVVGNEHKGVSPIIIKNSDQNIFIPMKGTVQSLNVAIATAILLFKSTN